MKTDAGGNEMSRVSSVGSAHRVIGKLSTEKKDIAQSVKMQKKVEEFVRDVEIGTVLNIGKVIGKTKHMLIVEKHGFTECYSIGQLLDTRRDRVTREWLKKQVESGKNKADIARNLGESTATIINKIESYKRKGEW